MKLLKIKNTDLTTGCIWKTVLKFSLPVLLSFILQNLYNMADAAICGQTLSAYDVAGVNDTGSISFLFLQFAFGCTAGMSTLLAENIGKRDDAAIKKSFATQLETSVVICVLLTATGLVTLDPLLSMIGIEKASGAQTNAALYNAAHDYMTVIIAGIFALYMYNFIVCTLRSMGDSLTPLIFLVVSSALNIALDLLFIIPCKMGVTGAALATVISQFVAAVGCFVYALKRYPVLRLSAKDFKPDLKYDLKTLGRGVPLGLQFSILAFGLISLANGVVKFDKDPLGVIVPQAPAQNGFAAANKVFNLFALFPNALGTAFISFISQNHGAGKTDRIRKGYAQILLIMTAVCTVGIGLCFLLTINDAYLYIFLSADKITPQSADYGFKFLLSHLPMIYVLGILVISRNTVQGLGKPLFPLLAGVAELAARILICMFLPQIVNGAPIDCTASGNAFLMLCFADPLAWFAADLVLVPAAVYYILKKPKAPPQNETETPQTV